MSPARGLRSFWAGLTTADLPTALGAIAFAAAELLFAACVVTPGALARVAPGRLKENAADDRAAVTVEALRMRAAPSAGRAVAYLGASNARMGLYDGGMGIPATLEEATGEPISFYRLFADGQTLGEWREILGQLPPAFRGVVVLAVFDRLGTDRGAGQVKELGLDEMALPPPDPGSAFAAMGAPAHRPALGTGVFFVDHFGFFAPRRGILARIGQAPRRDVGKPRVVRPSAKRWSWVEAHLRATSSPPILELLPQIEDIARALLARHVDVVLLEAPINPRLEAMKPPGLSRVGVYQPAMLELAHRTGAHYWNPSYEAGLAEGDFRDDIHLQSWRAQQRYEAALVERLGALLRGEAVPDGPWTPGAASAESPLPDVEDADDEDVDDLPSEPDPGPR